MHWLVFSNGVSMATGKSLDSELLTRLFEIPEVALSGFTARKGLTGSGTTILKGRTYFGSWRVTAGSLAWVSAVPGEANHFEDTVDDALRYTMLRILSDLQETRSLQRSPDQARIAS